jgi:hypothetical protein
MQLNCLLLKGFKLVIHVEDLGRGLVVYNMSYQSEFPDICVWKYAISKFKIYVFHTGVEVQNIQRKAKFCASDINYNFITNA